MTDRQIRIDPAKSLSVRVGAAHEVAAAWRADGGACYAVLTPTGDVRTFAAGRLGLALHVRDTTPGAELVENAPGAEERFLSWAAGLRAPKETA